MKIRTEARREALLEIASQVFLEKGYARTSMAEIAQREGASKATLYGYFPSKEILFLAVTQAEGEKHMDAAVAEMTKQSMAGKLKPALTRFGEALVNFLGSDAACATHRMVIAEAGHTEIGRLFYEAGPKRGMTITAEILKAAMSRGELRHTDAWIATQHLIGLINAEIQHRWFDPAVPAPTAAEARSMAERAVDVFLRGYAPDASIVLKQPAIQQAA